MKTVWSIVKSVWAQKPFHYNYKRINLKKQQYQIVWQKTFNLDLKGHECPEKQLSGIQSLLCYAV